MDDDYLKQMTPIQKDYIIDRIIRLCRYEEYDATALCQAIADSGCKLPNGRYKISRSLNITRDISMAPGVEIEWDPN